MTALATRDVRLGGRWSAGQRAKNDVLYVLAHAALATCSWLPSRAVGLACGALGRVAHRFARSERERAKLNVMSAFPALSERETDAFVAACFSEMARMLEASVLALDGRAPRLAMDRDSSACIAAALAEGRGVVLPSAHLGPWESVAATLVRSGVPLVTLVRESYDPRFDALLGRVRGRGGVRTIARGAAGAPMAIVRALRAGKVLGAPMDLASRVPSVRVPFLGREAQTAVGPARIALRTGAPVVVATLEARGGRREVTATRVPTRDLSERDPLAATTLTRRINDELSRRILTMPEAWPWMHDRWRDR